MPLCILSTPRFFLIIATGVCVFRLETFGRSSNASCFRKSSSEFDEAETGGFSCQKAISTGISLILRLILTIGRFRTFKLGFSKRSSIWGAGGSCKQNFMSEKRFSMQVLKTYSLSYGCYPLTVNWRDRLSDFRKKAKHQQLRYLTSTSDWASIQQTLEGFRRDPSAMSWVTEHPSGKWGRRGIWLVHCEMASISGASFTKILPLGDDLPGSCDEEHMESVGLDMVLEVGCDFDVELDAT